MPNDLRLVQRATPMIALQRGSVVLAWHVTGAVNHSHLDEFPAIARPALLAPLCRGHVARGNGIRVQGGERRGTNPETS